MNVSERKALKTIKQDNEKLNKTLIKVEVRLKSMQDKVKYVSESLKQQQKRRESTANKLACKRQELISEINSDIFKLTVHEYTGYV